MTNAATYAVERVFREGYRYSKAEVLLDLLQPSAYTKLNYLLARSLAALVNLGYTSNRR
ncbi:MULTISPECIES: hypothetical protein [Pseudomonas]|uniref:hypothetical protein n=1 Tax=Pseudomonas TaxID=286 RepID=UPI0015B51713|nr:MULTISPECIES: hypothetical protein [Pseudomonas]MBF7144658.1 hypothetical protein [Pseudomonas sp. LY10J]